MKARHIWLLALALLVGVVACGSPSSKRVGTDTGNLNGDVTGAPWANTVAGLKGNSLPSLASGCLQWSGSAWVFGSCGGSTSVTGTGLWYNSSGALNSAAVGFSGDVSLGTLTGGNVPTTVGALQGRSVSSSAPSTGNTLGWNGSAWAPGALNLAGGSNYVTGNLPVGNIAPGSSAQVFMTNATPATAWTTITQDLTLSAAGAATVNSIHGTAPVNVTNSVLSFGSTTAGTGDLRFPNAVTMMAFRNAANSADVTALRNDSSNNLYLDTSGNLHLCDANCGNVQVGNTSTLVNEIVGNPVEFFKGSTQTGQLALGSSDFFAFGASPAASGAYLRFPSGAQTLMNAGAGPTTLLDTSSGGALEVHSYTAGAGVNLYDATTFVAQFTNSSSTTNFTIPSTQTGGLSESIAGAGSSGAAGASITFTPQGANATNGTGGNVVVALAAPTGTGTEAFLQTTRGGTAWTSMGAYSSGFGGWWGNVAPSTTNFAIISSGTVTQFNAGSTLYFDIGGSAQWATSAGVMAPNSAGGVNIGSAASPWGASYFGYSSGVYVEALTGAFQPSSNAAFTLGGNSNRWGQTFIGGSSSATQIFDQGAAGNTIDQQQGLSRTIAWTYTQQAVGPTTAASGSTGTLFCPGSNTMAGVDVFWTARTSSGANYSVGESVNDCFNNAGTAACGTNATKFTTITVGTVCPSGAPTAVIAAGSGGCFVVNTTCPGWTSGKIDFQFQIFAENN